MVEAIVENIDVKVPFYEDLGRVVKPEAIFASNTSSLAITEMALASGRPDRFVGLHYFNPVQLMRLTEVIKTEHTAPEVFDLCMAWSNSLGKTSVACGDTPGFIVRERASHVFDLFVFSALGSCAARAGRGTPPLAQPVRAGLHGADLTARPLPPPPPPVR